MSDSSAQIDFRALYADSALGAWRLPAHSELDAELGRFRAPFLGLGVPLPRPGAAPAGAAPAGGGGWATAPMWYVCVDTLRIDQAVVLDRAAFLFARRIEVVGSGQLVVDRGAEGCRDLIVLAQEVVDGSGQPAALDLVGAGGGPDGGAEEVRFPFRPAAGPATGVRWRAADSAPTPLAPEALDPAHFLEGEPLRLHLTTAFQIACLLSTERPALAAAQLRWVAALARVPGEQRKQDPRVDESPELRDLAVQAHAMLQTLEAAGDVPTGALLVPSLDASLYAADCAAFGDLLARREQAWQDFERMTKDDARWRDAAAAALGDSLEQRDLAAQLEQQAAGARQQAMDACVVASGQMIQAQVELLQKEGAFRVGIETWKTTKIEEAVQGMVLEAISVIAQLPAVVTNISAAPSAIASKMAEGIEFVVNLFPPPSGPKEEQKPADPKAKEKAEADAKAKKDKEDRFNKLSGALTAAGKEGLKILAAAQGIKGIEQAAAAMETSSAQILKDVDAQTSRALSVTELQGLETVTGGADAWDKLQAGVEDALDTMGGGVLKEVPGGTDFRLAFRRQVICGKALSQARLALARATFELVETRLRTASARRSAERARDRLGELSGKVADDAVLAQLAFGRVLDARRAVYLALEAFDRASRYFALSGLGGDGAARAGAPVELPRISDGTDRFVVAAKKVSSRMRMIEGLARPPETMRDVSIVLAEPGLLATLRETGGLVSFDLGPDRPEFDGFCRVRMTRVRVFAEGLAPDLPVQVRIVTGGVYQDRLPDRQIKVFVGQPTRATFAYRSRDVRRGPVIQVEGDIAQRYRGDFFNPTPFTHWSLLVRRPDGTPLDLRSVTALTLHLAGEVLPIG